jgi:hypothetical protein
MLRITLDLLAPGCRTVQLSIPVHAMSPEHGWARVTVKEVSKNRWDLLWATLQQAERDRNNALKENASPQRIAEVRAAERLAGYQLLKATVTGHEASDFMTTCPKAEPGTPEHTTLLSALLQAGFTPEVATAALVAGECPTPFLADDKGAVSDATLELYERVSPDRQFLINLMASIYRFHAGEIIAAGDYWRTAKVPEEKIPLPFRKAAPAPAATKSQTTGS